MMMGVLVKMTMSFEVPRVMRLIIQESEGDFFLKQRMEDVLCLPC